MRQRICKNCGSHFAGEGEQRFCPTCRMAARQASVIRTRQCIQCSTQFEGGPRARYCPQCRTGRQRQQSREYHQRKAAGSVRSLGSVDLCQVCGGEYIVTGALQMYCPACAADAVRDKVLPTKRSRARYHAEEQSARKKELRKESAVCAYCGALYTPTDAAVTCSEQCAKEYKRIVQGMADYKRGRRKKPPAHERYASGLPQSDLPGVSYHRKRKKWQVIHQGKYVGLFASQEEAEAVKKRLGEQYVVLNDE